MRTVRASRAVPGAIADAESLYMKYYNIHKSAVIIDKLRSGAFVAGRSVLVSRSGNLATSVANEDDRTYITDCVRWSRDVLLYSLRSRSVEVGRETRAVKLATTR